MSDPFIIRNVRLFIWFRLFFNARFYYPVFTVMFLLGFFVSHYLNELTPFGQRATVLSFRGLACNLAYAGVGLLYTGLAASLRRDGMSEDDVFVAALPWLPGYFVFAALQMRRRR